jgi:hypothetical protein
MPSFNSKSIASEVVVISMRIMHGELYASPQFIAKVEIRSRGEVDGMRKL